MKAFRNYFLFLALILFISSCKDRDGKITESKYKHYQLIYDNGQEQIKYPAKSRPIARQSQLGYFQGFDDLKNKIVTELENECWTTTSQEYSIVDMYNVESSTSYQQNHNWKLRLGESTESNVIRTQIFDLQAGDSITFNIEKRGNGYVETSIALVDLKTGARTQQMILGHLQTKGLFDYVFYVAKSEPVRIEFQTKNQEGNLLFLDDLMIHSNNPGLQALNECEAQVITTLDWQIFNDRIEIKTTNEKGGFVEIYGSIDHETWTFLDKVDLENKTSNTYTYFFKD